MFAYNWIGLLLCVIGVFMVGLANVLGQKSDAGENAGSGNDDEGLLIFGMSLVMAGQVVQAAQVIAEEYLMKDVNLPAMQIVGWEGLWGTLMMFVIVYPVLYLIPGQDNHHLEDPIDTAVMLAHNQELLGIVFLYLASCGTFNATGIMITSSLSAVHRMMLDASRTAVIWAFGLTVGSLYPDSPFGEKWTAWSPLQLAGFLVIVCGQATYGEVLRIPCIKYPPAPAATLVSEQFASPGALGLASPLPRERYDNTGR